MVHRLLVMCKLICIIIIKPQNPYMDVTLNTTSSSLITTLEVIWDNPKVRVLRLHRCS